eukprot:TRINITY_DN1699_c0_g1_i1.p1 TRINITY_DN1699_c0_g1~~TRINITY_DN1699_c0_g1_i1.p1  ORF type:complete len:270 (+),score=54.04 TRINITY_DN1699_c0_g1_i1:139-948(+)
MQMTSVIFNITAKTNFGDVIYVVGSCKQLGEWDFRRAIPLKTDTTSFPVWSSVVQFPTSTAFEYKYFLRDAGNEFIRWEPFPYNRNLNPVSLWMLVDDGVFGTSKEERRQVISSSNYETNVGFPAILNSTISPTFSFGIDVNNRKHANELECNRKVIAELQSKIVELEGELLCFEETDHLKALPIDKLKEISQKSRRVADKASDLVLRKMEEQQTTQKNECATCMDEPVNTILLPCAHLAICFSCASKLSKKCPICNTTIESFHKVYMK